MSDNLPETEYTPESQLRHPRRLLKSMFQDVVSSKELAWRLMIRDISARYRQSLLGIFWAFLPPIATAFVFVMLNKSKVIQIGETHIPYPAFVMFGAVLWQIFVDGLNAPLKVIAESRQMLAKINFPKEALVLSAMGQTMFDMSIKLLIIIAVFILYGLSLNWSALFSLLAILDLALLGITFGLLITPIGVLYKDIAQGLTVFTGLWFFITPVVYPSPTTFPISLLATLNPVSPILVGARDIATEGLLHNPMLFFIVTILMFVVLFATWIIYRLAVPILVERISA